MVLRTPGVLGTDNWLCRRRENQYGGRWTPETQEQLNRGDMARRHFDELPS